MVPRPSRTFEILGQRFPVASSLLVAAVFAGSLVGANIPGLAALIVLQPTLVLAGQAWRLLTWPLVAGDALGLIFACLVLMWLGRDLCYAWGAQRYLLIGTGLAAATGAVVTLLGLLFGPVARSFFLGPWALVDALIVAWAILFPYRQVLVMFVLPLGGRQLIWGTVAVTAVFGLMGGAAGLLAVLPHFVAMGLAALYMRGRSLETLWLRARYWFLSLRLGRRRSRFKVVEGRDHEPPRWVH